MNKILIQGIIDSLNTVSRNMVLVKGSTARARAYGMYIAYIDVLKMMTHFEKTVAVDEQSGKKYHIFSVKA